MLYNSRMAEPKNLIILGPQGSGKGTQGKLLSAKFGIPHISFGELFRSAIASGSELGRQVKTYMEQGALVPDTIVLVLLREVLDAPAAKNGFVLDGFPRNNEQYEELRQMFAADGRKATFVYIDLSEDEAVKRLANRFICERCESIYIGNAGPCQKCGGRLIQRDDDKPEAVRKRLRLFKTQTLPMIAEIEKDTQVIRIDGAPPVEEVNKEILEKLNLK